MLNKVNGQTDCKEEVKGEVLVNSIEPTVDFFKPFINGVAIKDKETYYAVSGILRELGRAATEEITSNLITGILHSSVVQTLSTSSLNPSELCRMFSKGIDKESRLFSAERSGLSHFDVFESFFNDYSELI